MKEKKPRRAEIQLRLELSKKVRIGVIVILLVLSVAIPIYYLSYAYNVNRENGFPLDDPWIHLNFAKNLVEYGKYSYFKGEMVTAGSTSPIYTLVLAIGFLVTKNEMVLSYASGILFFSLSLLCFYKLLERNYSGEFLFVIAGTLLFVWDKWMNFISVSGMETTMYIFLLLACYYFYRQRNTVAFALTFGLIIWARPDGLVFLVVILADYLWLLYLRNKFPRENKEPAIFPRRGLTQFAVISGEIIVSYFAMNLILSGTLLPNTYNAKLAYYSPAFRSRADFLKFEVWGYFTSSSYGFLIVPFVIGFAAVVSDTVRRKYNTNLLPALYIPLMIFIYWYKLPYAARFGRYLMPVIPFYILLFTFGLRAGGNILLNYMKSKRFVSGIIILFVTATIIFSVLSCIENKNLYAEQCHAISIRQVAAAKWLKQNTPEGSVVATHDVGAIAFYSDRKVVDVVGLINPHLADVLLDRNYSSIMTEEMKTKNVNYIAFLREWYRMVNQTPLFTGGENNYEIMEIHRFYPEKTHILRSDANNLNMYALDYISNRQYPQAVNLLKQSLAADPASSLTYYYLGAAYNLLGDTKSAEKNLQKSLELFPSFKDAVFLIAEIYKRQGRIKESEIYLRTYLHSNPGDSTAVRYLSGIQDSVKLMNPSNPK